MDQMNVLISTLSFSAWVVIELMVSVNPSNTIAITPPGSGSRLFLAGSAGFAALMPFLALRALGVRSFFLRFFVGFISLILMSWYAGTYLHRDFYTYSFQIVLLYMVIFLVRVKSLEIIRQRTRIFRIFSVSALIAFVLWVVWLMLMGYTIVTRQEPRWIEATAYNLINGLIAVLILYAAAVVHEQSKRTIYLVGDELYLDGRNLTVALSPQESFIVYSFLTASGHTLTCSFLRRLLYKGEEVERDLESCARCLREKWTASKCPA